MQVTMYYNDGTLITEEGDQTELQEHIRVFSEKDNCSFWNYGEPTHRWGGNGWEPKPVIPFRFYWIDGKTEVLYGQSVAAAFATKYAGGAIRAVDWYDTKEEQTHDWDSEKKAWVRRSPIFDPK